MVMIGKIVAVLIIMEGMKRRGIHVCVCVFACVFYV